MFKKDVFLDMVESLGKNIGKTITHDKSESEAITIENLSDRDMLSIILRKKLYAKEYGEAEDVLFSFARNNKEEDFSSICEWFYGELSSKSDEDLMENNFSREEIKQGLEDFKRSFPKEE